MSDNFRTSTRASELIPCPFCPRGEGLYIRYNDHRAWVYCHGCKIESHQATMTGFDSDKDIGWATDTVVERWNTRREDASPAEAIKACNRAREALKDIKEALTGQRQNRLS